jgi:hypothetical protein
MFARYTYCSSDHTRETNLDTSSKQVNRVCKNLAIVNYNLKEGFIQKEEIGRNLEISSAPHRMHNV